MFNGVMASNTQIMSSVLSTSPELSYIVGFFNSELNGSGVVNNSRNMPLWQAIEELSENITVSLFSSREYL
jgi:hypothetical protein